MCADTRDISARDISTRDTRDTRGTRDSRGTITIDTRDTGDTGGTIVFHCMKNTNAAALWEEPRCGEMPNAFYS